MIIFPAIDIKDRKVVRLLKGEFDKVTEYGEDPVAVALDFKAAGAEWIHVIDLDGAKDGVSRNLDTIKEIVSKVGISVEVGGGIRSEAIIRELIESGVKRAIFGTAAVEEPVFVETMVKKYGDQIDIAVSLDCKDGLIAIKGWVETSDLKAVDFAKDLEAKGIKTIIYTDIARDGMLSGPNFEALGELADATNIDIIASGGVSSIEDLQKVKLLEAKGVIGAITGKAIYEGKIDLREAFKLC